jgi:autophagy-related protein 2
MSLNIVALRFELRVPPPRNIPRSGALIVDIHNIELRNGLKQANQRPHFTESSLKALSTPADCQPIFSVECERILVAHSLVGQALATTLVALGPLGSVDDAESIDQPAPLRPRFSVIQPHPASGVITALNVELPSAHVVVSKELLDGLQYFIDDVSQLFERFSQLTAKVASETAESGDTSLIGSRFFSKSRSNSGSALMSSTSTNNSENVVKVSISEGTVDQVRKSVECVPDYFDSFPSSMVTKN